MTEDKIKEYNKLLADFMGWKLIHVLDLEYLFDFYEFQQFDKDNKVIKTDGGGDSWSWHEGDTLPYNSDWNRLMLVVEYIENLGYMSTIEKMTGSYENHRVWFNQQESLQEVSTGARDEDKKIAVYLAVVYFIQWYNKNK